MQLAINNIGKHYNRQWLFRNIDFKIRNGESIAILGKNGSGKSTLLQVIIGLTQSSEGNVRIDNIPFENPHKHFSMTSPLLTLPLEFNIIEIFEYHLKTGKLSLGLKDFIDRANFTANESKRPLRYFSSGMLQRLKTAFCLFSESEIKLLDEPLTNMDKDGEKWYTNCIENIREGHMIIVASNNAPEYQFANHIINL